MASRVLKSGYLRITQKYKTTHKAVDLGADKPNTETVVAHSAGTVNWVQTGHKNNKGSTGNASYGNCVKISHSDGYETLYAHLDSVFVKNGQKVKEGEEIGIMGNTGNSYGTHLHWEVRKNGTKINPTPYLEKDLPLTEHKDIDVIYRSHNGKWYGDVTNYNNKNTNGYAGVQGKNMTALMAKVTDGKIKYRVHILGGDWLPWVTGYNTKDFDNGYAGDKKQKIDAVQMDFSGIDGYEVKYRISTTKNKGWLDWVTGYNAADSNGYAGLMGNPIDCIQMQIIKK